MAHGLSWMGSAPWTPPGGAPGEEGGAPEESGAAARSDSARAEAERVARALGGDRGAFADLIRIHRPRVQRVALRIVGNPEDAEDVAQEAFVRAWSGLGRLREGARLGPWLLGITVHLSRDFLRARGRRAEEAAARLLDADATGGPASRAPGPRALTSAAELRARVDLAIAALPTQLRVPFVLRALEGQSFDDIASITGVRPATVRTQMVQARRALRRSLGSLLDGEDDA